jgi:hypothetical protein
MTNRINYKAPHVRILCRDKKEPQEIAQPRLALSRTSSETKFDDGVQHSRSMTADAIGTFEGCFA